MSKPEAVHRTIITSRPYREKVDLFEEASADGQQCDLGPFVEPVDTGTVGDGGELTTPHSQRVAHGRETHHHLGEGNITTLYEVRNLNTWL